MTKGSRCSPVHVIPFCVEGVERQFSPPDRVDDVLTGLNSTVRKGPFTCVIEAVQIVVENLVSKYGSLNPLPLGRKGPRLFQQRVHFRPNPTIGPGWVSRTLVLHVAKHLGVSGRVGGRFSREV